MEKHNPHLSFAAGLHRTLYYEMNPVRDDGNALKSERYWFISLHLDYICSADKRPLCSIDWIHIVEKPRSGDQHFGMAWRLEWG